MRRCPAAMFAYIYIRFLFSKFSRPKSVYLMIYYASFIFSQSLANSSVEDQAF